MRIYDMHMHDHGQDPIDSRALLEKLGSVGITHACIFSDSPLEDPTQYTNRGASFEARMERVLAWCEGTNGRLLPVLWIHPDERGIQKKVRTAVEHGIVAFKQIPYNYRASDKKNLRLAATIAEMGKPIIYHAGFLWNNSPSAENLHPMHYEALLTVPSLRFALAHCAWPWVDECLAMFGKINYTRRTWGRTAEMFVDISPGTPGFYRRMMFERLFGGVYDMRDHLLFGVDSSAATYNADYARSVIERDNALYEEFGVPMEIREKIYGKNILRFLGLTES